MTEPKLLEGEASPGEFERRREVEQRKWVEAENLKVALHGVRALVTHALEGDAPDFVKAKRLCDAAEQLRRAAGTRVQDFGQLPGEVEVACDVEDGGGIRLGPIRQGRFGGGMEDLTRMLVGLLDRQVDQRSVVDDAHTREFEAAELESLLKVAAMTEGEQQTRIKKRIDVITKRMEESDGLVHPDVLGRHPTDGEGQGQDARDADRDDGRGAGGASPAPPQGEQAA